MKKVLLLVAVSLSLATAASAAPPPKIGYVDLQRTLMETKVGQKAKAKLESQKTEKQKAVNDKKEALKKAAEGLEKQRVVLKPEALQAKEKELQEQYVELQQLFAQLQQDLAKSEAQLTRDIFNRTSTIIDSIAKRDGYTMILEKNESAVLWADPSFDITAEVNKRIDAGEGASADKSPAPKAPEKKSRNVDAREIQNLLPHRYPFLLVDRVLEITPDKIVALKNVSANEPFFQGHFPGHPVMPGVLIVEALAQAGAVLAASTVQKGANFDPTTHVVYFMAMDGVKFRKVVVPGDQLILEVVPLRKGGAVWKFRGEAKVDGKVVAEAEMLASMAKR